MGGASAFSAQAAAGRESLTAAHEAMLRDHSLQFVLTDFRQRPPPKWLEWLGDAIVASLPLLKVLFWIGIAAGLALLAFFIFREVAGVRVKRRRPGAQPERPWTLNPTKARILLEETDRLAAEGRYDEAAHLLLLKGVEDVEQRRPQQVRPALTSREIASLPQLPEQARAAFAAIADVVERSLFGGHAVDERGWTECRRSYEALVLAEAWR